MKRRIAVLLALGMLPWGGLNARETSATTFRVTATVVEFCDVTAPDLVLGNYTAQSGARLQVTTLIGMNCTPNTTYNVGLNIGRSRKMVAGAQAPNLSSDSARSAISRVTTGSDTVTGVGTGLDVDHTVFGRFPATQVIPAGDYADSVTVRVYY